METLRKIGTGLLLTFVVFTAGYAVGKEVGARRALRDRPDPAPSSTAAGDPTDAPSRRLVACYFHSTKRCAKCNTIEAYAKEALDTLFPEQIASGEIEWRTANMDDVWNLDAVQRYGLVRSSLVLVDEAGGEERDHSVLESVWDLTEDKRAFFAYVQGEVEILIDARDEDPEASEVEEVR